MKLQWFWNATYEGLMGTVGEWLGKKPNISVVHLDIRPQPEPNGSLYWYWTLIYKE